MDIASLADLDRRGFVLVRGFLSEAELDALREDHASRPMDLNGNYNARTPTSGAIASFGAPDPRLRREQRRRLLPRRRRRDPGRERGPRRGRFANVRMEELAVTPHLAAGDLLLMRGDIVHRTQDADTPRVALSWRVAAGDTVIRRSRLATGCRQKAVMMRKHTAPYHQLFQAFDRAGKNELTLREVLDLYAEMPAAEPMDVDAFNRELRAERRRAHAVPGYVASYPLAFALRGLYKARDTSTRLKQRVS